MRRLISVLIVLLLITGCRGEDAAMERAMSLRDKMLKSNGCQFSASVTADYGEKLYTFEMKCQIDKFGNLSFEVVKPETISGIKGTVSDDRGALTFDDKVLAFELMADGQITPVCAPWILIHTLRGGYISGCGIDGDGLHMQIDDSYAEDALQMEIWTNETDIPIQGEILWKGRRILTVSVADFIFL